MEKFQNFTTTELQHLSLGLSMMQDPSLPCEICDRLKHQIQEELRERAVNKEPGIEKIPVPEEYRKLGVVDWEIEHG